MGDKSKISWTDATWNPVRGCSRVSEGCRHCYAERMAGRFAGPGQPYEGLIRTIPTGVSAHASRETRTDARWNGVVRMVSEHLADPLRWRSPRRIFVNSMSDLFHESLTNEQIAAIFGVMAAAPQHTFQILTKRATRMREWFAWVKRDMDSPLSTCGCAALDALDADAHRLEKSYEVGPAATWPLSNVWLGVSVENQAASDERIPELLATPAAVRFLSCEPLLGPVKLDDGERGWLTCNGPVATDDDAQCCESRYVNGSCFHGIDWVIAGCESGPGARPCEVDWLRSLRDQCSATGVAFWLKQAGIRMTPSSVTEGAGSKHKPGGVIELPYLDGMQHAAMPTR